MQDLGHWRAGMADLSTPENIDQLAAEIKYAAGDIAKYSTHGLNSFSVEQVRIALSLLEQASAQLALGALYQARALAESR